MNTTWMWRTAAVVALAGPLVPCAPAFADEWDLGVGHDNATATTDNRLFHGIEQVHDLAAQGSVPDVDHMRVESSVRSSYQVVIDGMTGDLDLTPEDVRLVRANGQILFTGQASGPGRITLTWFELSESAFVRITGAACGNTCTGQDRYRIRFYETTYTIPRFNNTGSQATVLIVVNRNLSFAACSVVYTFFAADGGFTSSLLISLPALGQQVTSLAAIPNLAGGAGSVRVTHTCGYSGLSGKAVAVEPATGFTFDTQMVPVE